MDSSSGLGRITSSWWCSERGARFGGCDTPECVEKASTPFHRNVLLSPDMEVKVENPDDMRADSRCWIRAACISVTCFRSLLSGHVKYAKETLLYVLYTLGKYAALAVRGIFLLLCIGTGPFSLLVVTCALSSTYMMDSPSFWLRHFRQRALPLLRPPSPLLARCTGAGGAGSALLSWH